MVFTQILDYSYSFSDSFKGITTATNLCNFKVICEKLTEKINILFYTPRPPPTSNSERTSSTEQHIIIKDRRDDGFLPDRESLHILWHARPLGIP